MDRTANFHAAMARLQAVAQDAVCPIYAIRRDESAGGLVGSGFLLKIGEELYLVTAAHVLYLRHKYDLYVPGGEGPVSLGGQAFYTGPNKPVASPDFGYDFACIRLAPETRTANTGSTILTPADLDVSDVPRSQTLYGFAGFPGMANATSADHKLPRNAHYYGGQPAPPDQYPLLRYDIETHFIMTFDVSAMVDATGAVVPVPEPPGMSGGPVWILGSFQHVEDGTAAPRVIGIAITWSPDMNVLSGVRMAVVVAAMRKAMPHLAHLLPVPAYVGANVTVNTLS